jgi:hypothetical protein
MFSDRKTPIHHKGLGHTDQKRCSVRIQAAPFVCSIGFRAIVNRLRDSQAMENSEQSFC